MTMNLFQIKNINYIYFLNFLLVIFILITLILAFCPSGRKYLYLPIISIIILIILSYLARSNLKSKKITNEFFNENDVLSNKINSNYDSDSDLSETESDTESESNENIANDLDTGGCTNLNNYNRESVVNDQSTFANWLYSTPKTCKENSMYCVNYEDVRFSRHNPQIDTMKEIDD